MNQQSSPDQTEKMNQYPTSEQVDDWCNEIYSNGMQMPYSWRLQGNQGFVESLGMWHLKGSVYLKIEPENYQPFYCYWQPVQQGPAPLAIHLPGYGAEMSMHPELPSAGFNVLHVNPLGYSTPDGMDRSKQVNGNWPVLPDTVSSGGKKGYKDWLTQVVMAVDWAWKQKEVIPGRVSFFGTSQGGGTSLLMGSVFKNRGIRCVAADQPFLMCFKEMHQDAVAGAYEMAWKALENMPEKALGWHGLGYADALSHLHRLPVPIMLTSGGKDHVCPAKSIDQFFGLLTGIKQYTHLPLISHGYTRVFVPLVREWLRMFA